MNTEITVEIQAHNKRHLDVHLKLPAEFLSLDNDLRKIVSQQIMRGSVAITLQVLFLTEHPAKVHVDIPLAKKMNGAILELASQIGCTTLSESERLFAILKERGILQVGFGEEDGSFYKSQVVETLEEALKKLIEMKKKEGAALAKEFEERLVTLYTILEEITLKSKGYSEKYYTKMKDLFSQLFPQEQTEDVRILKEIAILAEKSDISEEILRFSHHINHFRELLASADAQGKTFEFLLQELQREINTIGSKSQDVEIASLVIFAKSEIEKIREQIQNVE